MLRNILQRSIGKRGGKTMNQKNCGYLLLSEDGTKVALVVDKKFYLVNALELMATLERERKYTQIYKPL